MTAYHCPSCNCEISYGESICPNCNEDVTAIWDRISETQNEKPKVIPGMGGIDQKTEESPFGNQKKIGNMSPFPTNSSVSQGNPFQNQNNPKLSPFDSNSQDDMSPFPSPTAAPSNSDDRNPISNENNISQPFPPVNESAPFPPISSEGDRSAPFLEIPRIGGRIPIDKNPLRIGRYEIKDVAQIDLPDLNAYANISRKKESSEHFIITEKAGKYYIEDVHSTNGTYLGTTKLGPGVPAQPLKHGDKIIVPIEEFGRMVQLEMYFKEN